MVNYTFRKPTYPFFLESDNGLWGATNGAELTRILKTKPFGAKEVYRLIDSAGEGWAYYYDTQTISPLTVQKRWTKAKLVELYNSFIPEGATQFVGGSLANKKLARIMLELMAFSKAR